MKFGNTMAVMILNGDMGECKPTNTSKLRFISWFMLEIRMVFDSGSIPEITKG